MPELPEVETIVRQVAPHILNRVIIKVDASTQGLRLLNMPLAEMSVKLTGRKITDWNRQGKFFSFILDDGQLLVGHLRMTGRLVVSQGQLDNPHIRVWLDFDNGSRLNFVDIRRFATFHLIAGHENYPGLSHLGPDALSPKFTSDYFFTQLHKRKKPVYSALLDQSIVAGLGNIYVNEVLFAAKVNPLRLSNTVTKREAQLIHQRSLEILNQALTFRGTTLIDNSYRDAQGQPGKFVDQLTVYGKAGKTCPVCGTLITRIKISGRSVFFCKHCQK